MEAVSARKPPRGGRGGGGSGSGGGRTRGGPLTARRVAGWIAGITLVGLIAGAGGLAGIFLYYGSDPAMPRIAHVGDYHPKVVSRVLDRNGELLGEVFEERRTLVPREKIPAVMVHAILDAEDAQFYEHGALNYWGLLRALLYNLRPGAHLQGASTITQQLVKTYLLKTNERTVKRKVQEAILASRLETALSKDEILYLYLNQIYFGHRRYGIGEAWRFFFQGDSSRTIADMTVGEASLLAGLPKGPEEISPLRHPDRAKERQCYVLRRMVENRHLQSAEAERICKAPIEVARTPESVGIAPEFVDEAKRALLARFGEAQLPYLGTSIVTTCDARIQRLARAALERNLEGLDDRQGYRKPVAHLKNVTAAGIKALLTERSLHHLHQLLGDAPTRAQRTRWLEDREKALAAGRTTEAVVVEVRAVPEDHGLVVDTGSEKGFLRVPRPGDKHHDRYNPKEAPIEKRFAVGDVLAVRAEPSLGRHPASAPPAAEAKPAARADESPPHATPPAAAPLPKLPTLPRPAAQKPAPATPPAKAKKRAGKAAPPAPAAARGRLPAHTRVRTDGESGEGDDDDQQDEASGWPIVVPEFGPQGAVYVLDPTTREVRAIVGGYDFHAGGFNRATAARRQPGSAFKPFLYAAAFLSGRYTPATVLNDSPQVFDLPGLKAWKPKNAESHQFLGPVRLRVALARSLNTVAAQLVNDLTPGPVASVARQAGIESDLEETLALGLGASVVTLQELTNAYATFDAQGRRAPPRLLTRIGADDLPAPAAEQAVSPEVAYMLTSMMQSVIDEGTAASARAKLKRPAAGKTGTTSSERDAWFVGYTPDLVVGVWVGFDDMRDLGHGEQGARSALPVWTEVLTGALKGVAPSPFPQPAAIEVHRIDPATGLLAPPGSLTGLDEVFLPGTAPTEVAPEVGEQDPDTFIIDQQQ